MIFQKLSRLSRNFVDCPETFQAVQNLSRMSGNFFNCPETFETVRKLSILSQNFPNCTEIQTLQKLSRLSRNFPDDAEDFQIVQNIFRLMLCFDLFLGPILLIRTKTFRSAMRTRRRDFSGSGVRGVFFWPGHVSLSP